MPRLELMLVGSPTSATSWFSAWGLMCKRGPLDSGHIAATLNFDASSVLGLDWRLHGQNSAIAGDQGVKIWNSRSEMIHMYSISLASLKRSLVA